MSPDRPDLLPPSGAQYEIVSGRQRAVVTEVGACLREFSVAGTDVIDGFAVDERCSSGRGQILAPWPNRLEDGSYAFRGQQVQAALDEPALSNAIHGLVRWLPWPLIWRAGDAVMLGCVLHPQPAYPWRLALQVEYRLGVGGLTVTIEATNLAGTSAPFGVGFHPYLSVGTTTVDADRLLVPARRRLLTNERALPTGDTAVAGTEFDFTSARPVGPARLDTCYADLVRDDDGLARARLLDGAVGRRVTVWVDASFGYLMAFTGDTVNPPGRRRASIAIEPMTCPPNALRSGQDLILLDPGVRWRASWGITVEDGSRPAGVGVQRVPAVVTFPLRQRILRPHETVNQMALPGDDEADTAHFAAFDDGVVVATASVRREAPPWPVDERPSWRLRGMATTEGRRSQGIGAMVLAAVIHHVGDHGGGLLWCNARTPAVAFYRRAGFRTRGESWIEPVIGPHIAMQRQVEPH